MSAPWVWLAEAAGVLWLPGALVLAGALAVLVLDGRGRAGLGIATLAAAAAAASALCAASALQAGLGEAVPGVFGGAGLSGIAAVIYLSAAASLATRLRDVPSSRRGGVAALIGIAAVACQVLAGAVDLLVMAIALETVAVASYGIVAAARGRAAHEVAARYYVQGSVAAGLLVFGLAAAVGLADGATGYEPLVQAMSSAPAGAASVTAVLVLSALVFKAGAFPMHSWVPDAYEVVEPGAGVFVAGAAKAAAVLALWVLFSRSVWSGDAFHSVRVAVAVAAAASIVFGNFGALKQSDLGRMLGYSAIAQVGYALVGVVSGAVGTPLLVAAYAVAAGAAYGCLGALRPGPDRRATLESVAGAAERRPVVAGIMTVAMLSLTGIPLTAGFLGKLFVFYGAIAGGWTWLAVVAAVGSVVSFGYYGRVIQAMYFASPEPRDPAGAQEDAASDAPVGPVRVWPFALLAGVLLLAGTVPLATGFEWLLRAFAV